jgi:hypothetical protein
MAKTNQASDIGMRKARLICNMGADQRLEFIAEGLPIIFASAKSLAMATQALKQFPREAEILERLCEEECAKILILVDIIRCPKKKVATRVGRMMDWFYQHLARLIYANAQGWKVSGARELQEYIDRDRQSHYLEGDYGPAGEFGMDILPNWALLERESSLYADVMVAEDGNPTWSSPVEWQGESHDAYLPTSFLVVETLQAFGVFTSEGLKILAEVWGKHEFGSESDEWSLHPRDLFLELAKRLEATGLITEHATRDHTHNLINNWQLPMYNLDFSKINAQLEELSEQREANIPRDW